MSVWRYAGWLHNSTASYPRHLFSSAGGELSLERGLGLVYLECIWRCEELQVHGLLFLKHSGIRLSRGKFTLPDIFSLPVFSRRTFVRHLTHLTKVLILEEEEIVLKEIIGQVTFRTATYISEFLVLSLTWAMHRNWTLVWKCWIEQ